MISNMIVEQIKDLSRGLSRRELEAKYFEELEKLPASELVIIRDSMIAESSVTYCYPDFDNIY
jgi:hypothetical protein